MPPFRDDPTILAWGLANEPQCHGGPPGTIARWAHATAEFVRGLDPNHMVTLDCEGFLGPSSPGKSPVGDCRALPRRTPVLAAQ